MAYLSYSWTLKATKDSIITGEVNDIFSMIGCVLTEGRRKLFKSGGGEGLKGHALHQKNFKILANWNSVYDILTAYIFCTCFNALFVILSHMVTIKNIFFKDDLSMVSNS